MSQQLLDRLPCKNIHGCQRIDFGDLFHLVLSTVFYQQFVFQNLFSALIYDQIPANPMTFPSTSGVPTLETNILPGFYKLLISENGML